MDHAWLDSLSEDWVSQPRSLGSPVPSLPSLPSLSNSTSETSNQATKSSRIPKYDVEQQVWIAPSSKPLSERSANDHNLPNGRRSVRLPMKIQDGNVLDDRGRKLSRTVSASTTSSAAFGTVAHKSVSLSPRKGDYETPEWKRRLLGGDVAYGEQKDLFSPAGLENIFRPPAAHDISADLSRLNNLVDHSVMPSSPPPYNHGIPPQLQQTADADTRSGQDSEQQHKKEPRSMKYQLVDNEDFEHSLNDLAEDESIQTDQDGISAEPLAVNLEQMRTVSGQSEMRHEEFSPVFVGRPTSIGETLNQGPSTRELRSRLEQVQDATQSCIIESDQHGKFEQGSDALSYVFPDNRFVDLRRGGYSQDGSFQQRLLSLSSLPGFDESAMLAEGSIQASTPKVLAQNHVREAPRIGKEEGLSSAQPLSAIVEQHTPHTSPKRPASNQSGGSPLKLFGNYDTFTNQKLLRRLSQFELNQAALNDQDSHREETQRRKLVPMGNFGEGLLDDFEFSDENSFNFTKARREQTEFHATVASPANGHTFSINLSTSNDDGQQVLLRQKLEGVSITASGSKHTIRSKKTIHHVASSPPVALKDHAIDGSLTPRRRNGDGEGKRMPKSPLKDSTPKRRRTLQKADLMERLDDASQKKVPSVNEAHHQMQSVIGRKRKDARPGHDQQTADPVILAMRQMLRPRNPTPSQRPSSSREISHEHRIKNFHLTAASNAQAQRLAEVQAQLDAYDSNLSAQKPTATKMGMQNDSRKGSVTTQDFLNEAKLIMAGIRGKARSGLASLEESESENDRLQTPEMGGSDPLLEDSYQESTQDPFSRPPSREGKPLMNQSRQQQDPALLDYLRKYQERSEINLAPTSSVKLPFDSQNSTTASPRPTSRDLIPMRVSPDDIIESDPPNLVISENPDAHRKRKHSTSSSTSRTEYQFDGGYNSQGSDVSSGQTTGHSIPTGSSRNSDSRRIIAPHTVSHLIPEQLAGMFLDKEKNIWIKRKSAFGNDHGANHLPSDESEEDPFGDIPDLSVDETQELRRLRAVAAKKLEESLVMRMKQDNLPDLRNLSLPDVGLPETGALDNASPRDAVSSASHTKIAVRGGDKSPTESPIESIVASTRAHVTEYERLVISETTSGRDATEQEVEAEISILEDRVPATPPQQRRNVTISFSSPLAHIISSATDEDHNQQFRTVQDSAHTNRIQQASRNASTSGKLSTQKSHNSTLRSALRAGNRHLSLGGELFTNRPVSRIDEHDEEASPIHPLLSASRNVSVVVSTPLPPRRETSLIAATPQISDHIGDLSLTPLSEFTVHQADQSFGMNVSYVDKGRKSVIGANVKRTLSLSIRQLVEKITQVEPYEPFWEHLEQLDLRDKRLTSLHKLDEFCEHLIELDASRNQISQLEGIPTTVRDLRINRNQISDLAAWGHLSNLQYIDVSDNQIESLAAFRNLHHLRGLKADRNKLKSLDGITKLDGLIQLRLRANEVEFLDFAGTSMSRLTDLDLKDNRISQVRNLHELRSLTTLNLENNDVAQLDISQPLRALRYLKLSNNLLEKMDVGNCPDLRLLYVDDNRLESIQGLLKTKYLDTLSMREQQEGVYLDATFLSQALEVRKLFLSGNLLTSFQPQVEYLNLQYLELANCGLEALSPEFGYMIPNVRVLNLNFNALRDIRPLSGIARLKRLHLAGNRLVRLRTTTSLISQMPTLALVDLRNNPFTQGFYPSLTETRLLMREDEAEEEVSSQPFVLRDANRMEDDKYVRRLDGQTKMMRRLFEIMVLSGCGRLAMLDGLSVNRSVLDSRDSVWKALVSAGILRTGETGDSQEEGGTPDDTNQAEEEAANPIRRGKPGSYEEKENTRMSEPWHAEDSFA